MENGTQWFHRDAHGLHLLFEPFVLDDRNLFPAYIFVAVICASERGITYYLDHRPQSFSTSERIFNVMIRTVLYGIVTTLRLLYMLVIMYFNTGLFILVVSSLTLSQLVLEILGSSPHCNKTGPTISKYQNKQGYRDLSSTLDQDTDHTEDNEDEEFSIHDRRQYNIPKIVISNEECCEE